MKRIFITIFLLSSASILFAQQKLFHVYTDSAKLINDANVLANDFFAKVKQADASFSQKPAAILNTQPCLAFYLPKDNTINLPLWQQLPPASKSFFSRLADGNEKEAKKIFGAFFNGFYVASELGKAVQFTRENGTGNKYQSELFANTLAILYWRQSSYKKEMDNCYNYVNKLLKHLPDPVPAGENAEDYFQKNYADILLEPRQFFYFRLSQFKMVYEDKSLATFDEFIKNYAAR